MIPPLSIHSSSGPTVNDPWEKKLLTEDENQAIKPLVERISTLKQQGLTGLGIISSFLHRRVQPLKERENFGFEYSGAEDPSRMVPALELTDEEVLERLQKMLKGVNVVPHAVVEYCANNPPPAVSCFFLCLYFLYFLCCLHFLLNLSRLVVLLFYRNWGVTSLIQSPLMTAMPWWRLGRVLLEHI